MQLDRGREPSPDTVPCFEPAPPPFGDDPPALEYVFLERLASLGVRAESVESRAQARSAVEQLLARRGWLLACPVDLCWPNVVVRRALCAAAADFGLDEPHWAVAETGALVLMSGGARRRDVSLLPAVAGFFVQRSRLVARLGDVLRAIRADEPGLPPCVTMVTGPSASADIVGVRTLGVHGPGEVYVWLIRNE